MLTVYSAQVEGLLKEKEDLGPMEGSSTTSNIQMSPPAMNQSGIYNTVQETQQGYFQNTYSELDMAEPAIPSFAFSWDMIELGVDEPLPPLDVIDEL